MCEDDEDYDYGDDLDEVDEVRLRIGALCDDLIEAIEDSDVDYANRTFKRFMDDSSYIPAELANRAGDHFERDFTEAHRLWVEGRIETSMEIIKAIRRDTE